jgi:F0F1-type ATP synthase assembly protein I
MDKNESGDNSNLKQALFVVSDAVIGAAILLAIGVYAGSWLDKQFHTAPWFSTGLALFGGGFGLARMVMKANSLQSIPAAKSDKSSAKTAKKQQEQSGQRNPFDDYEDEQN